MCTQEQLRNKTEGEISAAVKTLLFGEGWHREYALAKANLCQDWSIMGPLIMMKGVSLIFTDRWLARIELDAKSGDTQSTTYESSHTNPLRAVCEVLLEMR